MKIVVIGGHGLIGSRVVEGWLDWDTMRWPRRAAVAWTY